jgi:hypothetical protein
MTLGFALLRIYRALYYHCWANIYHRCIPSLLGKCMFFAGQIYIIVIYHRYISSLLGEYTSLLLGKCMFFAGQLHIIVIYIIHYWVNVCSLLGKYISSLYISSLLGEYMYVLCWVNVCSLLGKYIYISLLGEHTSSLLGKYIPSLYISSLLGEYIIIVGQIYHH